MQAIYHGNCLDELKKIPDNSIDSIVTDPPYGLKFMAKKWDYDVPNVSVWAECLRVLKPGGHLLAFAGTRTQHRMAVNIEDAGFEIRDMVTYLYDTNEAAAALVESLNPDQLKMLDAAFGRDGMLGWAYGSGMPKSHNLKGDWEGWGTALKPALEPITLARKPFRGTVAANVKEYGLGAINIAESRIGGDSGRWPANLCHDGSNAVELLFPAQAGAAAPVRRRNGDKFRNAFGTFKGNIDEQGSTFQGDSGSAARFFYCPKASKSDRGPENNHPTVKPTNLMAYLCRLVTPPGGVVLDPFMGSGSTGKAAIREGFGFIGIEMDADYCEIARARIQHEVSKMEAANA